MRAIPTLKISISGVRGVVGESLTPTLLTRFTQAFGTFVGPGTIVLGRDTRTSGEMVRQAVGAGVPSCGWRVFVFGGWPPPAVGSGEGCVGEEGRTRGGAGSLKKK